MRFQPNKCVVLVLLLTSLASLPAQVPSAPGDWPQWRGPNRDGISLETGLLKDWPKGGPPVVWQVDHVGVGYSTVSVKDGRIFTQGDLDGVEHVLCLSAKDGSVLWKVRPEPAARRVTDRVEADMKRLDRDGDGQIDEVEALSGLGWSLHLVEKPIEGDAAKIAAARADWLVKKLDKDNDQRISYAEAPAGLRQMFAQIEACWNSSVCRFYFPPSTVSKSL